MLLDSVHAGYVFPRRVRVLADHLAPLIPEKARVLDVGSGDGRLASAIARLRPDVEVRGIDVLPREQSAISTDIFDGKTIPFPDASFEVILFVDVLHHTDKLYPFSASWIFDRELHFLARLRIGRAEEKR